MHGVNEQHNTQHAGNGGDNEKRQGAAAKPRSGGGMPWWFWHLFTAVGLVMLLGGAFWYDYSRGISLRGVTTEGIVYGYSQTQDIETDAWLYSPLIEFKTEGGQSQTFSSNTKSTARPYEVGDHVEIIYDPADPERALINSVSALYFGPILLLGIGLLFTALGLLGHYYIRPRLNRAA